jgi:hypothetical protein
MITRGEIINLVVGAIVLVALFYYFFVVLPSG